MVGPGTEDTIVAPCIGPGEGAIIVALGTMGGIGALGTRVGGLRREYHEPEIGLRSSGPRSGGAVGGLDSLNGCGYNKVRILVNGHISSE